MKPTGNSDGPDAKKAKIDPNETIVMKKVDDLSHLELYKNTPITLVKRDQIRDQTLHDSDRC